MEDWRRIRLGDACVTNADTYSPKEGWKFVNYLDTGNITDNRIDSVQYIDVINEKLPSRARRKVKKNSILFSTVRPNQRHLGIIKTQPDNFLVSTGFAVIDVDDTILDPDFAYYALSQKSVVEMLHAIAEQSTSAYPSIKPSDIEDVEIDIPSIETQKKIVGLLGCVDKKIELNTEINDNLRQQSNVLFDSYYSSGDSYPMKALSDIATIKYGKGLPTKELLPTGFPVFGGNGIIGSYNSYLYENPQILVSCRGAASGNILVSYPKSFVTNNSLVLELNDYRYFHFIKQYLLKNPLYSYATGSAQPQITIDNIKDVQVPYPDYDSIQSLTEQLSYYADMHYHNICENERLASIRDALLPKLMSGELDVSEL